MQRSATKTEEGAQNGVGHRFRLRNVSIGTRLAVCFSLIIGLMMAADAVAFWQFKRMEAVGQGLRKADQASRAVVRVRLDIGIFRERVTLMTESQETRELADDSAALRKRFSGDVETARQLLIASPDLDQNGTISSALETLRVALPAQLDTVVDLANAGDWTAIRLRLGRQIQDLIDLSSSQVEKVDQQVLQAQKDALEKSRQARRNLLTVVPVAALLTLLAASALGWYLTRSITVPLSELASGVHALARGDFQHELKITGNDELVVVGRAFNRAARQLQNQFEMTLEARVGERTRIARELHDTLLQSFHGLLLRFQTVSELLPERPVEAKEKLGSAIEQAAEAITEGRDAVQGLRDSTTQTNDLALAISTLGEERAADSTGARPAFRVAVEGKSRDLHPILRDEVYKIAAEALRNAFLHANATQVEVELRYDDEFFRLRVRDNGKGIDAAVLSAQSREGHYGLPGMRERATLIGGKLVVWSEGDAGTEVELSVPARTAYTTDRKLSWWSQQFAGKTKA
jgi:signal transduction histidine kinase